MSNIFLDPVTGLPTGRIQLTGSKQQYTTIVNAQAVTANGNTTIINVPVSGYKSGKVVARATGNMSVKVEAYSVDGTRIGLTTAELVNSASATQAVVHFDLDGLSNIAVYAVDTSAALNTVTIDLALTSV